MARTRWPALAINPSDELASNLDALAGDVSGQLAALSGEIASLSGVYVEKAGDTMTGTLTVPGLVVTGTSRVDAIQWNHPVDGNAVLDWEDDYLRFRFGGTLTPLGVRIDNYDTVGIELNRAGSATFAAGIKTGDGSAATPAYGFKSDDNTGPFLQAANVYSIAAAGVERFRLASNSLHLYHVDTGLREVWPRGHIYDWGWDTSTSVGSLGAWPANMASLVDTASVPANMSVTILVWAWVRLNQATDQRWSALDVTIGGTLAVNPVLVEQDLTTGTAGTGATGGISASHTHSHNHPPKTSSITQSHTHSVDPVNISSSIQTGGHTHTGPSHSHSLSASWKTLNYHALRSFTPTGSTVTIQARGGQSDATAQTYDDGALMWMVILN